MGEVWFYHLTRAGLAETLAVLLPRALEAGWRVAIRGGDAAGLRALDDALWSVPREGFVPHAMAGGARDADQPVLLTQDSRAANDPACVMAVLGAEIAQAEMAHLSRACILFDGRDAIAVEAARGQWRRLTEAGIAATYWSQQDGPWARKAQHPKPTA